MLQYNNLNLPKYDSVIIISSGRVEDAAQGKTSDGNHSTYLVIRRERESSSAEIRHIYATGTPLPSLTQVQNVVMPTLARVSSLVRFMNDN
jgi:hypothetical protein